MQPPEGAKIVAASILRDDLFTEPMVTNLISMENVMPAVTFCAMLAIVPV